MMTQKKRCKVAFLNGLVYVSRVYPAMFLLRSHFPLQVELLDASLFLSTFLKNEIHGLYALFYLIPAKA